MTTDSSRLQWHPHGVDPLTCDGIAGFLGLCVTVGCSIVAADHPHMVGWYWWSPWAVLGGWFLQVPAARWVLTFFTGRTEGCFGWPLVLASWVPVLVVSALFGLTSSGDDAVVASALRARERFHARQNAVEDGSLSFPEQDGQVSLVEE